jgi:hypothetical protein
MGLIFLVICIVSAVMAYAAGGTNALFWAALIVAAANLWSFGILQNYKNDPKTPQFWTTINFLTAIGGVGLLVYSIAT